MTDRALLARQLHDLADRVDDLDPAGLAGELEALKTTIVLSSLTPSPTTTEDRLLTIDEAKERLALDSKAWLRRRPDLPFVVKLSDGVVRYSSKGIDAYIASRRGPC